MPDDRRTDETVARGRAGRRVSATGDNHGDATPVTIRLDADQYKVAAANPREVEWGWPSRSCSGSPASWVLVRLTG